MTIWIEKMSKMFYIVFLVIVSFQKSFCLVPVINSLPTLGYAGELTTVSQIIHIMEVSDPDGDAFTCSITSITPSWGQVIMSKQSLLDKYVISTDIPSNAQVFDHANTSTIVATVTCDDTTGTAPTADFTLDIVKDDYLVFTNLPGTKSNIDALGTGANAVLYTVTSTSNKGNTPSYSFLSSNSEFTINSGNGQVKNVNHLNRQESATIDLWISVTDGTITTYEMLRLELTNMNSRPTFDGFTSPTTTNVNEDTATGTLIYTLTPLDNDPGATLTYSISGTPTVDAAKFSISTIGSNLGVYLQSSTLPLLDFESNKFVNLSISVDDTILTTTVLLYINVADVQEACYFLKTLYHVTAPEGASSTGSMNPSVTVKDYDGISPYTLSFVAVNNSNWFTVDASTGIINFAVNFGIDTSDSPTYPTQVWLQLQCTDNDGNSGTTQIEITITDVNDNAPDFSIYTSTVVYADQTTTPGATLGTFVPTDADKDAPNNVKTCSGTSPDSETSTYYTVATDCSIRLESSPAGTLPFGTTKKMVITAVDQGNPVLTSSVTVDIVYREVATTTVTTTTTTSAFDIWDDPGAVAAIALAIILGTILTAVLLYFLIRCCYLGYCCGPDPCDFCNFCRNRRCCEPRHRQSRVITPTEYRSPKKRADEFDYYDKNYDNRYDSDYESLGKEEPRRARVHNPSRISSDRQYPDFPRSHAQNGQLSPSYEQLALEPRKVIMTRGGYLY